MKKFFAKLWLTMRGKKTLTVLSTIAGYGIAQAQIAFPLGIPTGLAWPPVIPWEVALPILATLGIGVGLGDKMVQARKKNSALSEIEK